jgi:hypothetical protein
MRVAGIGTLTRGRSCEDVRLTELSVGERGPVLGRSGSTPRDVPSLVREPLILADHEA